MKKGRLKMLFAAMLAGVFLMAGCGAAEENEEGQGNGPIVQGGASNLILMVSSPISDFLYNRNDPELVYTVTVGLDNQAVEESRLALVVHDLVDGERVNSQPVLNLTSGATLPTVGDGLHQLQFVVTDQSGAPLVTVFINYATDITPPTISFTSLTNSTAFLDDGTEVDVFLTNDPTPLLQYVINEECFADNSCGESILVDGLEDPNAANGQELSAMNDGLHKVEINYSDDAGNSTTLTGYFVVDATAPVVIVPGGIIETADTTPILSYPEDDPCFALGNCTVTVLVDGQWTNARNGDPLPGFDASGNPLPPLSDGLHTVEVTITDGAGNSTTVVILYLIDATAPIVLVPEDGTINSGPDEQPVDAELPITANETSNVTVYLDPDATCMDAIANITLGDVLAACDQFKVNDQLLIIEEGDTLLVTLTGLTVGEHLVVIVATDNLGNPSVKEVNFTVVPDLAPTVTIVSPASQTLLHPDQPTDLPLEVVMEFKVSDDLTNPADMQVVVTLETWTFIDGGWSMADSGVIDIAGFTLSVTDQEGTYTKLHPLTDGHYRLVVTVTDDAGNVVSRPSAQSIPQQLFSVDTTAPVVVITSPVGPVTDTDAPLFELMATEQSEYGVSVFLCKVETTDSGSTCVFPDEPLGTQPGETLPPMTDGEYELLVEVTDAAGFTGSDQVAFSINAVAPFVEILNPEAEDVVGTGKANLKYNVHNATDIKIFLNGPSNPDPTVPIIERMVDPFEPIPRTYKDTVDLPVDGQHTITVRVFDANSPFPDAQDMVTFIADSRMPGVVIVTPNEDNRNFRSGQDVSLTFTVSDNPKEIVIALDGQVLDDVDPDVQPINLGPFSQADGVVTIHNVTVTVTNANGSASDSVDFIIDDSAPVVNLLSPSDGATSGATTVTLSYTVNDPSNSDEGTSEEIVVLDEASITQRSGDNISVAVGEHTISVQVVDLAGNQSNVAGATFTIIDDPHQHQKGEGHHKGKHRRRQSSCFIDKPAHEQDALDELVPCESSDNSKHND